jgi:CubicO group peptidase (beta-lactamase class C family)
MDTASPHTRYFPDAVWQRRTPAEAGIDGTRLQAAIDHYGFMNFYVNKDRTFIPSAPASAFGHQGNGTNFVYVDPENDLVAVLRWIDRPAIDGFVKRLLEAVR